MSLLAAILSQTNKILGTLINFTSTFPTSTINTINTNTQPSAIASDVQTGMNNNGYNSTRAGKLDYLDASISSVSAASNYTTRPQVSVALGGNSSITVLNVGGPGILNAVSFVPVGDQMKITIVIDGVTVISSPFANIPAYMSADGHLQNFTSFRDSLNAAPAVVGGSLNWHFRSSCVVTAQSSGGGNNQIYATYQN